ncbi:murein hydrolase activator EnvC family protein [Mucilaginibacter sp. McL0603]|uniref:murein hydrolase activator EnvC family protein n=1 Tax=Mucilaginibacter sp. McL0603 TaxID=3415670 RepID=UPI003CEA318C
MKFFKILFFLIGVFIAVNAHAQSSDELKRRRDKYNEELQKLNQEYEETANNKKSSLKQLNLLKAQINLREEKISNINSQVRLLDNQISESTNTVHSLQSQLDQLRKEYAAMILFAYRNQSSYNKLMFIFAAKDFNQSYKRLKYLQQFGAYRERQAQYIEGTEQDLHVKINELDNTKKQKSTLLVDQVKEKETLGKQRKDQVQVVADLSRQQGQLKDQQRDLQRKITRTNQEINAAIRREIEEQRRKAEAAAKAAAAASAAAGIPVNKNVTVSKKTITKSSTTSEVLNATPEAARLSNDFLGNKGSLPWPVTNGVVVQGFGIFVVEGIKSENNGIDIKTNENAPVRAVFEGKVAAINNVYGTYIVIIIHGEYFTVYSNLKSVSVSQGQKVSTKQNIGVAAMESASGIPKVNFQLWKGSTPVNPKIWLVPD